MKHLLIPQVRRLFNLFGALYSYRVRLIWQEDGDICFGEVSQAHKRITYFSYFIRISTSIAVILGLYIQVDHYLEKSLYFQLTFHIFWIFLTVGCSSFQYIFLGQTKEIIELVNQTINLSHHLGTRLSLESKFERNRQIRILIFAAFVGSYVFQNYVVILPLFVFTYREKFYLSSFFMGPIYKFETIRPLAIFVALLYEAWWDTIQWGSLGMVLYIHLLFVQTMMASLSGLRAYARRRKVKSSDQLLIVLGLYSKIRLLSILYNISIGKHYLTWFKSFLVVIIVSGFIVLVKLFVLRNVLLIGLSTFVLILGLTIAWGLGTFGGRVNHQSVCFRCDLLSWNCTGKVARRGLRSYKVVGLQVAQFYTIQRGTCFMLFSIISNAAMSLLVSITFDIRTK